MNMKSTVTRIDNQTLKELKIMAAQQNKSVAAIVRELSADAIRRRHFYLWDEVVDIWGKLPQVTEDSIKAGKITYEDMEKHALCGTLLLMSLLAGFLGKAEYDDEIAEYALKFVNLWVHWPAFQGVMAKSFQDMLDGTVVPADMTQLEAEREFKSWFNGKENQS